MIIRSRSIRLCDMAGFNNSIGRPSISSMGGGTCDIITSARENTTVGRMIQQLLAEPESAASVTRWLRSMLVVSRLPPMGQLAVWGELCRPTTVRELRVSRWGGIGHAPRLRRPPPD